MLSGPGGIGKSYLALSWPLPGKRQAVMARIAALRVRRGPVRIAGRIADQSGGPAPDNLYVLERPAPLWTMDKGESNPGEHWSGLWKAIDRIGAHLVVIDPASAALERGNQRQRPGGRLRRPWSASRGTLNGFPAGTPLAHP